MEAYLDVEGIVGSPKRRRWTRFIPATASSPRIPRCPAPASAPGSPSSARAPNCSNCSATRPPRGGWRKRPASRASRAPSKPVTDPEAAPQNRRRDRFSADHQGRVRRRRTRHARGGPARRFRRPTGGGAPGSGRGLRQRRRVPGALHPPRRATSKCRSWATATATSCTCTSAIARCSAAIRRWWRWRRRSTRSDDPRARSPTPR